MPNHVLKITVTEDEFQCLKRAANVDDRSVTSLVTRSIRDLVRCHLDEERYPSPPPAPPDYKPTLAPNGWPNMPDQYRTSDPSRVKIGKTIYALGSKPLPDTGIHKTLLDDNSVWWTDGKVVWPSQTTGGVG